MKKFFAIVISLVFCLCACAASAETLTVGLNAGIRPV